MRQTIQVLLRRLAVLLSILLALGNFEVSAETALPNNQEAPSLPTCTLKAEPQKILVGNQFDLIWATSRARSASFRSGSGAVMNVLSLPAASATINTHFDLQILHWRRARISSTCRLRMTSELLVAPLLLRFRGGSWQIYLVCNEALASLDIQIRRLL